MKKLSRTYRLETDVIEKIEELQEMYSNELKLTVSQADIIKLIVVEAYTKKTSQHSKKSKEKNLVSVNGSGTE